MKKGKNLPRDTKLQMSGNEPFFKSSFGCNTHVVLAIQVTPEMTNGGLHTPSSEVGA
jgi:hypothetical protein